ncbi:hypothetical protein [Kineococcus indalonis]|uniref:hypothetical protein n=1 Tax=Kineococcus indalonis TaxID=2696566 RepID=UPI001411BAD8|nr:hypothetical protein [Kineococcus indalonis]
MPGEEEHTVDKSPRNGSVKKAAGKSLKEKRVDKKAKSAGRTAAAAVAESVASVRRGR